MSYSAVERLHLKLLPAWIQEVYRLQQRLVDIEGYVALEKNPTMTEELDQLLKNLRLRRILEIYDEHLKRLRPAGLAGAAEDQRTKKWRSQPGDVPR